MNGWKQVKLGDICSYVCSGGTPKSNVEEYYDGDIPWLNTKEVDFNRIYETERSISQLGFDNSSAKWVEPNTIVVAMYGATAGKIGIIKNRMTTNQACCNLFINPLLADYNYVYYFLKTKYDYMLSLANGGAQQNLNVGIIKQLDIPLPDLETQKRIARILSSLDDKIELNNQINRNLEEQGQILLDQYSQEGLSIKLRDVLSFVNGFAFKSNTYILDGGYKIITIKNVQDGKIDSRDADTVSAIPEKMKQDCILQEGDTLLSLTGNVGRVGIVCEKNLLLNQRVAKVIPHDPNLNAAIYYLMRRKETKDILINISRGTAQANLSPVETLDVEVPFSIESLQRLAPTLQCFFYQIVHNEKENQRLQGIRDALLPEMMSGANFSFEETVI